MSSQNGLPDPPRDLDNKWLAALLVAITLITVYWRMQGVDPPSLRLDDQWLGIMAGQMSLEQFFEYRPPVPLGFALAQAIVVRTTSDPEWPLQVLPVLASIIQIPLFGLLLARLTGRGSVGVLGAALLAVNPELAHYAVTPKQYASDSLVTVCLLMLGEPLLREWRFKRGLTLTICALITPLLAFPSVFVGMALVNGACLWCAVRSSTRQRLPGAGLCWLLFHGLLMALYWLLLRGQGNEAMQTYWDPHFVNWESAAATASSTASLGWQILSGALPPPISLVTALVIVGLIAAGAKRDTRALAVTLAMFVAGVWLAAALRIYPMGTGRTDIYSYPVTILLVAMGIETLCVLLELRHITPAVITTLAIGTLIWLGEASQYDLVEDAALVHEFESQVTAEDLVIVYPHAEFALGYYSSWEATIAPLLTYAHGFEINFERENTLELPPPDSTDDYPQRVEHLVTDFLNNHDGQLYYIATHIFPRGHAFVRQVINAQGYREVSVVDRPSAQLIRYVRADRR